MPGMLDLDIIFDTESDFNESDHPRDEQGKFTHEIHVISRDPDVPNGLASEHTSLAQAEKAQKRLVSMSNGKRTKADFPIVEKAKPSKLTKGPDPVGDEMPTHFAFDRSMRSIDQDGHLHVECVNISKANVCPYLGREIPNHATLGLDPGKIYMLWRHPAELEAAAATFENKQLMIQHVGVTAESPQEWLTVGVVSGVFWQAPYLKARLTVWNQKGIDAIESKAQQELSSGYRYVADMTPGTIDGAHYDGIMRSIRGNHVALVSEGRVGPDVFVTDEFPQEYHTMKASLLAATLVTSLGLDKKPEDVTAAINAALAADKVATDAKAAADKAAADKAAEDKKASDEAADKAARDKAAKDAGCKPEDMVKGADGNWGLGSKAKDEEFDPDAEDVQKPDGSTGRKPEGGAPNPAQDAIDAAVKTALAARDALHAAREDVKPLLGVVTTFDSAEAVYGAALDHLKVDRKDVHPSALRALFRASTKQPEAVVGDAKSVSTMDQAFPQLNRLRR